MQTVFGFDQVQCAGYESKMNNDLSIQEEFYVLSLSLGLSQTPPQFTQCNLGAIAGSWLEVRSWLRLALARF